MIKKEDLLSKLPQSLREELFSAYEKILANYREGRWEPSELNGGKYCEVVYSILRGHVDAKFPAKASKPRNMFDACKELEKAPEAVFPRSVRIQIPRMLVALYEIRNNRGVGHVGGDVDPNYMDATCVLHLCKWILAELVRIFHQVDTQVATLAVEEIVSKVLPIVWEVNGKLRVLDSTLSMKDRTFVLLYHSAGAVKEDDLLDWVEHSNGAVYRRDILKKAHKAKFIEYDFTNKTVVLSPTGIQYVEQSILGTKRN